MFQQSPPLSLTSQALPRRALNALGTAGIRTLDEAAEWSDRDLLSLPNFGHASVARLRALIRESAVHQADFAPALPRLDGVALTV